jgi:hypothetical protein
MCHSNLLISALPKTLLTRRIEARQTALNILPSGNAGLVDEQVKPGLIIC